LFNKENLSALLSECVVGISKREEEFTFKNRTISSSLREEKDFPNPPMAPPTMFVTTSAMAKN
jgi:hypothetical protein